MKERRETSEDVFIAIPTSLAGIFVGVLVLFFIFARDQLHYIPQIIWGFVVLGIIALFFAYSLKKHQPRRR